MRNPSESDPFWLRRCRQYERSCVPVTGKNFPPLAVVNGKIVLRGPGQFKPDPKRRNILSDAFYRYFVLQYFDAGFNLTVIIMAYGRTYASPSNKYSNIRAQVTASQLYGADEVTENQLRSFADGKLKTDRSNDEHYPPHSSLFSRIKTTLFPAATIWVRIKTTAGVSRSVN